MNNVPELDLDVAPERTGAPRHSQPTRPLTAAMMRIAASPSRDTVAEGQAALEAEEAYRKRSDRRTP